MSQHASVTSVQLFDRNSHRNLSLVLDPQITFGDVKALIEQGFSLKTGSVVGLWNNDVGAMFPLSVLTHVPYCFDAGARFELVHRVNEDGLTIDATTTNSTVFSEDLNSSRSPLSTRSPRATVEDVTTLTLAEAIEEARHLLGNDDIDIELFSKIATQLATNECLLNRQQLHTCFRLFQKQIEPYQHSEEYKLRRSKFIDLVFDSLKYETVPGSSEVVGVRDLLSMLTVLCVHNVHKNFEIVFRAYDAAGDGFISEYMLLSHLYVVFGFLNNLSQHVREHIASHTHSNGDPRRFAREVWKQLISDDPTLTHNGGKDDGVLYASNFVTACESLINSGYGGLLFDTDVDVNSYGFHTDDVRSAGSLTQRRHTLGLFKYKATYVLHMFTDVASADGLISITQYHRVLAKLIERPYNSLTAVQRATCDLIITSMFQLFDDDCTGYCDMTELASALVIYCGGDSHDKARALFSVLHRYKPAGDAASSSWAPTRSVSLNRMSNTISMVFKAAMMLDDGEDGFTLQDSTYDTVAAEISLAAIANSGVQLKQPTKVDKQSLPKVIPQAAFEECLRDTFVQYFGDSLDVESESGRFISPEKSDRSDTNGTPDVQQFDDNSDYLYNNGSVVESNLLRLQPSNNGVSSFSPDTSAHQSKDSRHVGVTNRNLDRSEVVNEMREVQAFLGMSSFPAEDIIETLGDYAFGGIMSREGFTHTLTLIARLGGVTLDNLAEVAEYADRIFTLFESAAKPGHASLAELTVGLTCLCASSFEDKLLVSFTMLDSDEDNQLTLDQLSVMLLSYLRVIYVCSGTAADKIQKCQLTLTEIANAVTSEAVNTLQHSSSKKATGKPLLLTLEMVTQVAQDCMELADNVTGLSSLK
jgi:Ca2+-binding EF-hand superfamily protein